MSQRIRAGQPVNRRSGLSSSWLAIALLVALALTAAIWWLSQRSDTASTMPAATTVPASAPGTAPLSDTTASGSVPTDEAPVLAPLDAEPQEPENLISLDETPPIALPPLPEAGPVVSTALGEWLGKDKTYAFIQSDGFVRRFVATVDNLPRQKAPAQVWPVNPTAPRFLVEAHAFGQSDQIAAANAARYQAAVQFAQSLDMAQAARHYKQYYPLFQQAYEDLGYPGKYFNDRLVAVIDHLLQAPEPASVQVHLVEVKGEHAPQQPWVRYEFVDPALQALSSGQKVLVRMGPENGRAIKAQLRAFRSQIAAP